MSGKFVRQQAGNVMLETHTGGFPLWFDLTVIQLNGSKAEMRLAVADISDLRYCIQRVIEQAHGVKHSITIPTLTEDQISALENGEVRVK